MKNLIFDLETTGINAMVNRITCISYKYEDNDKVITIINEDEKRTLQVFWALINTQRETLRLTGFNSDGFDVPFLIKRSLINSVPIPKFESLDLRKLVNGFFYSYNKYTKGSLDDWAGVLGMSTKKTNGTDAIAAWTIGDWETLKEHCIYDVQITDNLFKLCKQCNLV